MLIAWFGCCAGASAKIDLPWRAYLGEYPWHQAYDGIRGEWEFGRRKIEAFATIADRYVERSGHNYSVVESFNLTIPGPHLMRGLDLRLAEGLPLSYCDVQGRVLFKNPSVDTPGNSAAVVDPRVEPARCDNGARSRAAASDSRRGG